MMYLKYLLKHVLRLDGAVGVKAAHGMLGLLGCATLSKALAHRQECRCQVREHLAWGRDKMSLIIILLISIIFIIIMKLVI